jgi:phytoene desaturase
MNTVVIGAGLGGLAAAIRLRARGHQVVVLEGTDQPGGRAQVLRQDGFVWDTGPTVITAPPLLEELFSLGGARLQERIELVPVDPFYQVRFADGETFDYVGDEERLLAGIERLSPPDVDGYRRLAAHCREVFGIGYEQLGSVPFDTLGDMLRVVPDMLRLRSDRSVYDTVATFLRDERLRQAFTFQPLLIGGNPFRCSSIYLLVHWLERRWGVHWVKGGTNQLVRALVALLDEMGVEVRCDAVVDELLVEQGRVSGVRVAGRTIPASCVVANADPAWVYSRMMPGRRSLGTSLRLRHTRSSMGLFVGYLGTKGAWPALAHHTIALGPRYRELIADIFDRKVLADDFSLYVHRPAATDPSLAPAGHEALYVLSPVPNNRSGLDWELEGPRYLEHIVAHLDQTLMPGLEERLVVSRTITPRWFEDQLRTVDGAGFGPEPRLLQSAWFRWHNRSHEVDGLYFVGAGTHPGAGVPGVLCSARVLDRWIPPAQSLAAK